MRVDAQDAPAARQGRPAAKHLSVTIAIYSPSGSTPGIGFAVPLETTNHVVLYLIAAGRNAVPVPGLTYDP
ncbi:hypothetical protein [Paracoccus fontiphilus]|uniref:hypothetical protein n=1 Tax=Paracoccus fontiphilus TaxID=1815556 RepID=UPI001A9715FA|nr:hypothetical protein [Paracoccus fontiphilus]